VKKVSCSADLILTTEVLREEDGKNVRQKQPNYFALTFSQLKYFWMEKKSG
jgi:hypothetical protein